MSINLCLPKRFLLIAVLAVVSACTRLDVQPDVADVKVATTIDSLVTAEWLSQHLDDPDLVVLDCTVLVEPDPQGGMRIVNGRANYESGHIPSAGFADLMGDLSDSSSPLEFALPSPEQFAATMGALGVGDDSRVVLYDANSSVWAARVWWMLRWVGFDRAAVLDGGLKAWTLEGGALSTEPANRLAKTLTPAPRPELIAYQDEVRASLENDDVQIIDVLPDAHYRGEMAMYARPGHIPGAYNIPSFMYLDEQGRYRSYDELDMLTEGDRNARTITYCGGGIAASSNAFILTRLGFKNVAVYDASLEEWAANPDNPMETGSGKVPTDN